jgi:magnesium chelatase accessory protein
VRPAIAVGHSAGALISSDGARRPHRADLIVSLNGALLPFRGSPARLRPLAGCSSSTCWCCGCSHGGGGPSSIERLIRNTGSTIDAAGVAQYAALVAPPMPGRRSA